MARALVKTHIRGFDRAVLRGGSPEGRVLPIVGGGGTAQSSLGSYVRYHSSTEWSPATGHPTPLLSQAPRHAAPATALEAEFLADGIVHLRLQPVSEPSYQRRVQCVKMRSVNQDSDDHPLLFENGRFEVARAIG